MNHDRKYKYIYYSCFHASCTTYGPIDHVWWWNNTSQRYRKLSHARSSQYIIIWGEHNVLRLYSKSSVWKFRVPFGPSNQTIITSNATKVFMIFLFSFPFWRKQYISTIHIYERIFLSEINELLIYFNFLNFNTIVVL